MKLRRYNIQLLALVFAASCGGGPNPDRDALKNIPVPQNVSGQKFSILSSEEGLNFGDGTLSGTGSVRFADDLGGVETAFNYSLVFSLEDDGELTLVSHSSTALTNGIEFTFKRIGSSLSVQAKAGSTTDDWSSFFAGVDASEKMKISIDVHNNEALTHVIFWNDLVSESAAILDSGADVDGSPGKGYGQNWGLKIKDAEVVSVRKGGARDAH